MITEYIKQCGYSYDKLKDIVYLVGATHTKQIHVDTINARILDLSGNTKVISGHNISLTEDTSLDERYQFAKSLEITMDGYVKWEDFETKYYVIVEDLEGTKWMMNVDFPSTITYTFTLNSNTYATTFTFTCNSNYPMLRLMDDLPAPEQVCPRYRIGGIKSLNMIENDRATYSETDNRVTTYGKDMQKIDFAKDSLELTETYDGDRIVDTISFKLPLNSYKYGWRYDLLGFMDNKYSAIISPYTDEFNKICVGFRNGLEPRYSVETGSNDSSENTITATFTEVSDNGLIFAEDLIINDDDQITYIKVSTDYDECVGDGQAQYLLKKGVMKNGRHAGGYMCYSGYTSFFEEKGYDIVGEFDTMEYYETQKCSEGACSIDTDMPYRITLNTNTTDCKEYHFKAACDWTITDIPSFISISQTEGYADESYTVTICNTIHSVESSATFTINAGNTTMVVTVNGTTITGRFTPTAKTVTCISQEVPFFCQRGYDYRITHLPTSLSVVTQTYNSLVISVPANNSTQWGKSYNIQITDAAGSYSLIIAQQVMHEAWQTVGTMCDGDSLYNKEQRLTGSTQNNLKPINEYRRGSLIESGSSQCQTSGLRWTDYGHFICQGSSKWTLQEEEYSDGDGTWTKTGSVRLGTMVESGSSYCNQTPTTSWNLTNNWICENDIPQEEPKATLYIVGGGSVTIPCNGNTTLTRAEVSAATPYTSITSVVLGDCVGTIGSNAFSGCTNITNITFNNTISTLSSGAFRNCSGLTSVTLPSSMRTLGDYAFYSCSGLTSIDLASITSIGEKAFSNCVNLRSVTIPSTVSGLNKVGSGAFYNCSRLTTMVISAYMNNIPDSMCEGCTSLEYVNIPWAINNGGIGNDAFNMDSMNSGIRTRLVLHFENIVPPVLNLSGSSEYRHFKGTAGIQVPGQSAATYSTADGYKDFVQQYGGTWVQGY